MLPDHTLYDTTTTTLRKRLESETGMSPEEVVIASQFTTNYMQATQRAESHHQTHRHLVLPPVSTVERRPDEVTSPVRSPPRYAEAPEKWQMIGTAWENAQRRPNTASSQDKIVLDAMQFTSTNRMKSTIPGYTGRLPSESWLYAGFRSSFEKEIPFRAMTPSRVLHGHLPGYTGHLSSESPLQYSRHSQADLFTGHLYMEPQSLGDGKPRDHFPRRETFSKSVTLVSPHNPFGSPRHPLKTALQRSQHLSLKAN